MEKPTSPNTAHTTSNDPCDPNFHAWWKWMQSGDTAYRARFDAMVDWHISFKRQQRAGHLDAE